MGLATTTLRPREAICPPGWRAQLIPDGIVILHRTGWKRWNGVVIFCAWLALLSAIVYQMYPNHIPFEPVLFWGMMSLTILSVIWLLFSLLFRFEIYAGKNMLEIHRVFGVYRSIRQIENGAFRVLTRHDLSRARVGCPSYPGHISNRHTWTRTLCVDDARYSILLDRTTHQVTALDGDRVGRNFGQDDIALLSLYLADLTGWELIPETIRYRDSSPRKV